MLGLVGRAGLRRRLAVGISTVLVGSLLPVLPTVAQPAAAAGAGATPRADVGKAVPGSSGARVRPRKLPSGPRTPAERPRRDWPEAATATIRLAGPGASPPSATAGGKGKRLPLTLAPAASRSRKSAKSAGAKLSAPDATVPAAVTARILSRQHSRRAGVDGLLFTLQPSGNPAAAARQQPGPLRVGVDYGDFAGAYGGGYASRLRLVELPACAATAPDKAECRIANPLATRNDTEKHTLTASSVPLRAKEPTVLAAVGDDKSVKGDYKATSLSPSATWNTNLNTGDFTWSYDMPVPEVPGGLKPNVGLSYSSGSIDGRTGNSNNQGSWAGDGFELWPGYIERRYKPCSDDGEKHADGNKPGDLCWGYDNAFISFNGKAGELVPAGKDTWKLQNDDGTKIRRLTSAARDNGDNDSEYWELTDPSGTRFYFGYHKLPGWAAGKDTTDSTWTVPVFGNDSGEDCHKDTFKDSWCQQGWRWNLDYVVDPHGDAISYYYDKETNSYGRDLDKDDDTPYTRGGYLKRIEYGRTSADLYAGKPLAQVSFANSERCLPQTGVTCAADTIDAKSFYWYDTPWDLNCKAGTTCDQGRLSPTFWTRKRLTRVTTEVLKDGALTPVDSWALNHRWGKADVDYQLELESIQHTGHTDTKPLTLPKTTFAYTQLANRLDKTGDGYAPYIKDRLSTIADEYGGQTDVNYSKPACTFNNLPTPESNTTLCFPQFIGGSSSDDMDREWFNKYVVESVTTTDRTGGAPDQVTRYDYLDDAAWHYDDDDGLTKEKFKTWSQWRGYGHVRVQTGGQGTGADAMKTQEDSYFLRGMDGDRKNASGGSKDVSVSLSAGEGEPLTDDASAAGFAYKAATFSAPGGKVLAKTVSRPWHHQTAKKTRDWGTVTANFSGTASTRAWTSLDDGAGAKWRTTTTASTFDTVAGRVTELSDRGDDSTTDDDRCTRTTYATNTDKNILTLPTRVETVATECGSSPDRAKEVISDVRTAYDGGGYGAVPTKGDATAVATLKKHDGTTATYLETGTTYDGYGRPEKVTDLTGNVTAIGDSAPTRTARTDGRTTTTAYTPATGIPTKTTVTTPPADAKDTTTAQTTTTELDPLRGQPAATIDTNGKRTTLKYDALGRSLKVWLPDRARTTVQLPNYQFDYYVEDGKPATVATRTLNPEGDSQAVSYTLYDGYLRPRQTQAPGPDAGWLISDTFYNERGLAAKTFAPYYVAKKPERALFKPADALSVETQTWKTYDGLGRETESRDVAGNGEGGKVLAVISTLYRGDRTTVIPPTGGIATTTVADARGQTTQLLQHHTRSANAPAETTRYTYSPAGKLAGVTDPAGNSWAYQYDQLGNQTWSKDPDKGITKATFDDRSQQISTEDANGAVLATVYDGLGRKTELHDKTASGPLRAKWVYDIVTKAKGQLAESTRYVDGKAYTHKITEYDPIYRPERTATVIPESEGALAGTYTASTSLYANGLPRGRSVSQAGNILGKGWNYAYDDRTMRVTSVYGTGIRSDATYTLTGKPLTYKIAGGGKPTQVTNTYEWGTQRLANSRVDRQDVAGVDQSATYGYDPAGNVTSLSDVSRTGTDTQCFTYDYLRRLTEAWTQDEKTCAAAPAGNLIAGPAPYWQSYGYDAAGNRTTLTQHDPTGDSAKDAKSTYGYPKPGTPQPHALTTVDTTGPTGTSTSAYSYDNTGNTTTRTLTGDKQTLTWDVEGHLTKVTEPADDKGTKTTSYVYDADGNRLITRTGDRTTLTLGGHTELTLDKGADKPKATRYIPLGSGNQAVLADDGTYTITLADRLGTGQLAINAADQTLTQRRQLPFGGPRGTKPANWPGTKGYVGGTDDTADTGLTHLGAREYDPETGRFLSVDPVLDPADPQQINGYTYSNNNPLTFSDPTGQLFADPDGSGRGTGVVHNRHGGMRLSGSKNYIPGPGACIQPYCHIPYNGPTRYEIYPGISAPFSWGKAPELEREFKEVTSLFKPWGNPRFEDGPLAGVRIMHALSEACYRLEGGCPDDVYSFTKHIAMAGVAAVTEGELPGRITGRPSVKASDCLHSFTPDTEVALANGKRKRIEDVKTGDKVIATDPATGKTTTRPVVATIVTKDDKHFTDLTVKTPSGDSSIIATNTHPFWSVDKKKWINAGDLRPGTELRTPQGTTAKITTVRHFSKQQQTHDLTIAGTHTYYVLAGQTPVLVHNSNGWCGPGFRTASEAGISPNDAKRIQNAADKAGQPIVVVGSRAGNGNLNPTSDWDYILTGPSRTRHSVKNSLPRGAGDGDGSGRGRDFYQSYNPNSPRKDYTVLERDKPYVVFEPRGR
ncbi:polymorphic toxin-type HINT domain-containing protein [Streptomyces sp. RPA4-5]|uniref:polymorphic toxin-type HINT domain-containing protein n=1 Tax=Streptomyces sp. RPA4-5 TaxID=2721245 RepID=UPI002001DED0|nr:polymorphic toxin-type HINT domain-containing protein [Streptomyces sp. RPA4-5]